MASSGLQWMRQPEDNTHTARILATPSDKRSWRMSQQLLSYQQFEQATVLMSRRDQESRLKGVALVISAKFNAVGFPCMNINVPEKVSEVINILRNDPNNFSEIIRPNGRVARISHMKPSHYLVLQAGEALTASIGWSMACQNRGHLSVTEAGAFLQDCCQRVLMRLSGNFASTVSNLDGTPNPGAFSGMSSINVAGEDIPANVVLTHQLLSDFDLHPKKIAWCMNDMLYQVHKTPAINQHHGPSLQRMAAAADALVAMASSSSGVILDPKEAAKAALQATAAHCALTANYTVVQEAAAAAPAESCAEDAAIRLCEQLSVKELKTGLANAGVPHSHCVEKSELVRLLAKTQISSKPAAHNTTSQQHQQGSSSSSSDMQPAPCDISPWLHAALFWRAEAAEAARGRQPDVQEMYRAAMAAVQRCPGGDELYGCLIAWNTLRALVDGGAPFKAIEGLQLLDLATGYEAALKAWLGWDLVRPRIKVMEKQTLINFKKLITAGRQATKRPPSSSSTGSSYSIKHAEVRKLLQPDEEHLVLQPDPDAAEIVLESVIPSMPDPTPCANCKQLFHTLKRCTGCNSVFYCGKECQMAHWVAGHKKECKVLKAQKDAKAASKTKHGNGKK